MTVNATTMDTKEAGVDWFYEKLQDFLELTPKKDTVFIKEDLNGKVESQEIPGRKGKVGPGMQN